MGNHANNTVSNEGNISGCHYTAPAARTQTGVNEMLRIFYSYFKRQTSKRREPKALYKNQIAHSGLDKNMPIY